MRYDNCLLHIEPEQNPLAGVAIGTDPNHRLLLTIVPHRPVRLSSGSPEDDWSIDLEVDLGAHEFEIRTLDDDGQPRELIPLYTSGEPARHLTRSQEREQHTTPYAWPSLAVTPGATSGPGQGTLLATSTEEVSLWVSHGKVLAQLVLTAS